MKILDAKKIIIIFTVLFVIVGTAIVLALTNGNVKVPSLSATSDSSTTNDSVDPNGVFYQRTDENGNVIYTLTNQEIFNQMKANDGINQLLLLSDQTLLADYINQVTPTEVQDKIKQLTYGTSDDTAIAAMSADTKQSDEDQYNQAMVLAGYAGNEEQYAKILVAREKYVEQAIRDNGEITGNDIGTAFVNSYFQDISAIKIRFTSQADVDAVMHKFNLVYTKSDTLGTYNGYVYQKETLTDPSGNVVQAYQTVDAYYYDANNNIINVDGSGTYVLGSDNTTYTISGSSVEYHLDNSGNLVDADGHIIISSDQIFTTIADATNYKTANTTYYTVTRSDPFDMTETINVLDAGNNVVFTINPTTHKIYDANNNDVTDTTSLYVNKVYKTIDKVTSFTTNDVSSLTDQEILDYYIQMYNYVYGEYRTVLPENSTSADLVALNNSDLQFSYDTLSSTNANLATYMFYTLSSVTGKSYTARPQDITDSSEGFYLVYKLTSPQKLDLVSEVVSYLEPLISIPTQVGANITLPASLDYYNATLTWTSSNANVLSSAGVFTRPSTDTNVTLTYTLTVFGQKKTGTITVTCLASGDTVAVTAPTWTEIPVQTLINDDTAYNAVLDNLVHNQVYGKDGTTTVKNHLISMRQDLGFTIYDRFLAWDYQSTDSSYTFSNKGDSRIIASYSKTLTSDQPFNITANELFKYAVDKSAALYTVYAAQYKELVYSDFYKTVFGDNTNIKTNNSLRMKDMASAVTNTKSYYNYMKKLYAQYGMTYTYSTYQQYAYAQYSVKSDFQLEQHYVVGELQPFLVRSVLANYNILDELKPTVDYNQLYATIQDYYNNYFSLNVSHVLFYLDRNEDGTPDNYTDFYSSLSGAALTAFNEKLVALEDAVNSYSGTLANLVTEYNNATREDPTWGPFKQLGFQIMTQSLNIQDKSNSSTYHSLTYAGQYGVKDTYDHDFVVALENLYKEYQLPQNASVSQLDSDLVSTQFGLHRIEVTQGDNFAKPSCKFTVTDSNASQYPAGLVNTDSSGMPTLAQVEIYAEYKFYSLTYDLSKTDVETLYNITVPQIPATLKTALDTYVGIILDKLYVIGTVNIGMADNLSSGTFTIDPALSDSNLTNTAVMKNLNDVKNVYFKAMFDQYGITDTSQ